MLTILTGIHTIHQDGVLTGESDMAADSTAADMVVITEVTAAIMAVVTAAIMVAGTIHGTPTVGVDILTGVAVTMAADMVAITVAAIGAVELLIIAIVFTEDRTTPDQADRMQRIMAEEVQHWVLRL